MIYNKLLIYCCICALFSCATAPPPPPPLEAEEEAYHTLVFLAYYSGTPIDEKGSKSFTGHASISINRTGVWGFYPNPKGKLASKRGQLVYSAVYPREQEYAEFTVDAGVLADVEALIAEWEAAPPFFAIPFNDCVSFVHRVCERAGLRYNPFALLPVSAIQSIRDSNDHTRIYKKRRRI